MQDKNERGLVGDFFCGAGAANPADERCGKLPRGGADAREQLRLHVAEGDTARFERSTPSGEQLPQAVQQRGQARHELRTLPQEGRNQPPEHSQHCAEQCQQGDRRRRAAGQPLFHFSISMSLSPLC